MQWKRKLIVKSVCEMRNKCKINVTLMQIKSPSKGRSHFVPLNHVYCVLIIALFVRIMQSKLVIRLICLLYKAVFKHIYIAFAFHYSLYNLYSHRTSQICTKNPGSCGHAIINLRNILGKGEAY